MDEHEYPMRPETIAQTCKLWSLLDDCPQETSVQEGFRKFLTTPVAFLLVYYVDPVYRPTTHALALYESADPF